jgi:hypothetical protein
MLHETDAPIGPELTEADRQRGREYLAATRDGILLAVQGLSDSQAIFTPAERRWSIALVLEHLATIEQFFLDRIVPQLQAAGRGAPGRNRNQEEMDALIMAREPDPEATVVVPGRDSLAVAPPPLIPTGVPTAEASLRRFLESRAQTQAYLESPPAEFRKGVVDHPALGPLDGYQWVLFLAAHSARHTKQILGLRNNPAFPGIPVDSELAETST